MSTILDGHNLMSENKEFSSRYFNNKSFAAVRLLFSLFFRVLISLIKDIIITTYFHVINWKQSDHSIVFTFVPVFVDLSLHEYYIAFPESQFSGN